MGLKIDEFYDLNQRQFNNICEGYVNQQTEAHQNNWEQSRMGWYFSVLPNSKKGLKPTDLIKFPWEENQTKKGFNKKITTQKAKEFFAKWDDLKFKK